MYPISDEPKTRALSKGAMMVTLLTLTLVLLLGLPPTLYAQSGVILWNKLGSMTEIQNSEIGPNGQIMAPLTFAPVQHGDGVALGSGTAQVKFNNPFGTSFPNAGTIEFWWTPGRDENSSTGSHFDERFAFFLTSDQRAPNNFPEMAISLQYSGNYQNRTRMFFGANLDRIILEYDLNYKAGDLIHVAITWDKSLGSSPARTFFNGVEGTVVMDFSTNAGQTIQNIQDKIQNAAYTYDIELMRFSKRPDGAQNQFDAGQFIDNIKLFDFAKTDFSDRFTEGFDTDGDGIPDNEDDCPTSNLDSTVSIDGCDSGVINPVFSDGCTLADIIDEIVAECADGAKDHGKFVSCFAKNANDLKKDGIITGDEKGALQSCAGQSSLP